MTMTATSTQPGRILDADTIVEDAHPSALAQPPARQDDRHASVQVQASGEVAAIQATFAIAQEYPRDEVAAYTQIMHACKRPSLAETAAYEYPRGGSTVTGPSIRMAEVLARAWGRVDIGWRELQRRRFDSDVETHAIDMQTLTRASRTFVVRHVRRVGQRNVPLYDERDIYENMANAAARRMRACILQLIPGDVVEAALNACERTMREAGGDRPISDRVRDMVVAFDDFNVSAEMISARLGHDIAATSETGLATMRRIYNSMKDGASNIEDWFKIGKKPKKGSSGAQTAADGLADDIASEAGSDSNGPENGPDGSEGTNEQHPAIASPGESDGIEPGNPTVIEQAVILYADKHGVDPTKAWQRLTSYVSGKYRARALDLTPDHQMAVLEGVRDGIIAPK